MMPCTTGAYGCCTISTNQMGPKTIFTFSGKTQLCHACSYYTMSITSYQHACGSWTCSVCHTDLHHSMESICCDGCLDRVHMKCTGRIELLEEWVFPAYKEEEEGHVRIERENRDPAYGGVANNTPIRPTPIRHLYPPQGVECGSTVIGHAPDSLSHSRACVGTIPGKCNFTT